MADVVSKEAAISEVNQWLADIQVKLLRDEQNNLSKGSILAIENLADQIQKGFVIINSDKTITQNLQEKVGDGDLKQVNFTPRFTVGAYHKNLKDIDRLDAIGRSFAIMHTMSVEKHPLQWFEKLSRVDYQVAESIVVFF